jgi:hypothetical protein
VVGLGYFRPHLDGGVVGDEVLVPINTRKTIIVKWEDILKQELLLMD